MDPAFRRADKPIFSSKVLLPLVCYVFQDGPWRDTLVRFSYDPRKDPNARLYVWIMKSLDFRTNVHYSYQRLYFRNANHPIARPSVTTRRQDRSAANVHIRAQEVGPEKEADRRSFSSFYFRTTILHIVQLRKSHLFDGQTVTKETAAFQLCDITDPMLKEMIEDPEDLREECNVGLTTSGSARLTHKI